MNALTTLEFWKFAMPVLGAAFVWLFNQWRERSREEYLRKEKLYRELVDSMQGFYETSPKFVQSLTVMSVKSDEVIQRQRFLDQLRFGWLYCPDEVIRKAYAFLDTVNALKSPVPDDKKELAFGEVVAAMRRDLLPWRRTKLSGADYRHLKVNV